MLYATLVPAILVAAALIYLARLRLNTRCLARFS